MLRLLTIAAICVAGLPAFAANYQEICGLTGSEVRLINGPTYVAGTDPQNRAFKAVKQHDVMALAQEGVIISSAYSKLPFDKLAEINIDTQPVYCVGIVDQGVVYSLQHGLLSIQQANALILSYFARH